VAYKAHEAGFDVFLGNFRGVYPRRMARGRDMKDYWKYNLDHLAHMDVKAFIYKIHQLKTTELRAHLYSTNPEMSEEEISSYIKRRLTISFVGHSLGGMVLPMYIINQRR
jgi:predicted alpha/beta hydrolase